MHPFDRTALADGVRRREVLAWAGYDFANSGYTTVVLTAVFNAYFVSVVAGGVPWATLAWTLTLAASNVLVLVSIPGIGALTDRHNNKKALLGAASAVCVTGTAALAWVGPGDLWLAVVLVVLSNYAYALGEMLIAAFLPELARSGSLGRVSGWGWSFGYFGGMLTLGLSLAWVISAQGKGLSAAEYVPGTMAITAAVYFLAAIPTFIYLRERPSKASALSPERSAKPSSGAVDEAALPTAAVATPQPAIAVAAPGGLSVLQALVDLRTAFSRTREFPDFRTLLWVGAAYQAGLSVVVALAAVYAAEAMSFTTQQTMLLVFVVNIASAIGAFLFGYMQDQVGHARALAITLIGWILMVLIAGLGKTVPLFWTAATFAGLCMGSSQSCGRAMVGVLAPNHRNGEFFGLWTFASRLATVLGPLAYGTVTWLSHGNHRLAILATGCFFVFSLLLLTRLNMRRGTLAAQRASGTVPAAN